MRSNVGVIKCIVKICENLRSFICENQREINMRFLIRQNYDFFEIK